MGEAAREVASADGAAIASERSGAEPPGVLARAALQNRATYRPLTEELSARFTVFNYDRRSRGGVGDLAPYAVEREIEDLAALRPVHQVPRLPIACGLQLAAPTSPKTLSILNDTRVVPAPITGAGPGPAKSTKRSSAGIPAR